MPQKGQSLKQYRWALDRQARTARKLWLLNAIAGALNNAQAHKEELKKLLDEETKENTKTRQEPKT